MRDSWGWFMKGTMMSVCLLLLVPNRHILVKLHVHRNREVAEREEGAYEGSGALI